MPKYKVGDVVTVRTDLKSNEYYDYLFFAPEMCAYRGKTCQITTVYTSKGCDRYYLNGAFGWTFSNSMFTDEEDIAYYTKEKENEKI